RNWPKVLFCDRRARQAGRYIFLHIHLVAGHSESAKCKATSGDEMNLRNAAKLCFWALIGLTIFSQESPVGVARAQEQDNVPKASPEMQHWQKLYLGTSDFTETYGTT